MAEAETEERPMNPYLYFSKLKRAEVRAEVDGDEAFAELSGGKRNAEATKRLGVLWKALSEEDKRRCIRTRRLSSSARSASRRRSARALSKRPTRRLLIRRFVAASLLRTFAHRIAGRPASDPVMVTSRRWRRWRRESIRRARPTRRGRRDAVRALADTHTQTRRTKKHDAGPRRRVRPALRDGR